MNALTQVRNTQRISREEVVRGTSGHASWHDQYKASAYVYAGGLSFDLTEGDVLAVFSQYGEVVDVNLVRSKDTGKSKGFAFLCYEDQRSTVLAVDNLNGAKVAGRIVRVEHVQDYKKKKLEEEEEGLGEEEEGLGGQGVVCAVADASDVNQGFRRRNKEGSSSSGGRGRGRGPEEEKEEEDGGNADNKSGGERFPWEASDSVFNILKEARKEVYGEEPRDERGEEDRQTDKRSHKRRKHRHKHRRKHRHDH